MVTIQLIIIMSRLELEKEVWPSLTKKIQMHLQRNDYLKNLQKKIRTSQKDEVQTLAGKIRSVCQRLNRPNFTDLIGFLH